MSNILFDQSTHTPLRTDGVERSFSLGYFSIDECLFSLGKTHDRIPSTPYVLLNWSDFGTWAFDLLSDGQRSAWTRLTIKAFEFHAAL